MLQLPDVHRGTGDTFGAGFTDMSKLKTFIAEHAKTIKFSWHRVLITVGVVVFLVGILVAGTLVYAKQYENRVLPGVYVGEINVGGMEYGELVEYLQTMQTKLGDEGIHFSFGLNGDSKDFIIYPTVTNEESARDLIVIDPEKEADYLLSYRKDGNIITRAMSLLWVKLTGSEVKLHAVSFDKEGILEQIESYLKEYISEAKNASVQILSITPLSFEVTSSSVGVSFDYEDVAGSIIKDWSSLKTPEIRIKSTIDEPKILEADVENIIDRLPLVFEHGQLDINYRDPHTKQDHIWFVSLEEMADWLEVQKKEGNGFVFGLNYASTTAFLGKDISSFVNVEAKDAKFEINPDGKVTEFQGSRPGVGVDVEKTYEAINTAIQDRTLHDEGITRSVTLLTEQVEPNVKTGEVNNLGISEIIGIGHSKFRGSTPNRLKNIRHAAFDKLYGLLIKPGEEFSLINALKPFTVEGGYFADYTIKGDKMVKEIGGGLCQIGTTMFRTAMNSGLEITERREHSLAVPYYNDLTNGNPGVDATIYDPHPDLRFINDTGNYILITAELNIEAEDLRFYFWGTSDGRNAYYTAPQVSRWIPTGEPRMIETTDLAPGVQECQYAYAGANASFKYIIERPNGEKDERVFSSYYRPLPKICLVGVEKLSDEECTEGEECPSSSLTAPGELDDAVGEGENGEEREIIIDENVGSTG